MSTTPKLALSEPERQSLRKAKIRLADVASHTTKELSAATGISDHRCQELIALAELQTLGSVGLRIAQCLLTLGFPGPEKLKQGDPVEMYDRLAIDWDGPLDPCVEDTFRCAVAQARDPHLPPSLRNWWAWTPCRGESEIRPPKSSSELSECGPRVARRQRRERLADLLFPPGRRMLAPRGITPKTRCGFVDLFTCRKRESRRNRSCHQMTRFRSDPCRRLYP